MKFRVYFAELIVDKLLASTKLSQAEFVGNSANYKISIITKQILDTLKKTIHL